MRWQRTVAQTMSRKVPALDKKVPTPELKVPSEAKKSFPPIDQGAQNVKK